jgi:hypothetical protein
MNDRMPKEHHRSFDGKSISATSLECELQCSDCYMYPA